MSEIRVMAAWPAIDQDEANRVAEKWKKLGYMTAILIEEAPRNLPHIDKYIQITSWQSFPHAVNILCHNLKDEYDIIVLAGNDVYPDSRYSAQELGRQFQNHFKGFYGVMQPTGDKYGAIEDAAICPWIGIDYVNKIPGPYNEVYYHYYSDAELQDVATLLGCFQQRDDIIQYHDHWGRHNKERPTHLLKAKEQHDKDRLVYRQRKRQNFPNSGV